MRVARQFRRMMRLGWPLMAVCFSGRVEAQQWASVGPYSISDGLVEFVGASDNVAGAIEVIAVNPADEQTVYVGTVNGGIWRTTAFDSFLIGFGGPHWEPLTDFEDSLSIASLRFDPTDNTYQTLIAGTGRRSAFFGNGGRQVGLLLTEDGGLSWDTISDPLLDNQTLRGVAKRGDLIVAVSSSSTDAGGGLLLRLNSGSPFFRVSDVGGTGLPEASVFDLEGDPTNNSRLYATLQGEGVYTSNNMGLSWTDINSAAMTALVTGLADNNNIEIAVGPRLSPSSPGPALAVGFIDDGILQAVFHSINGGQSWTQMDTPTTHEGDTDIGINPEFGEEEQEEVAGGQGGAHFSIAIDPFNPYVVYVGGDRQPRGAGPDMMADTDDDAFPNSIGALKATGRLFRGNALAAAGSQWEPLTHNNALGSAPHADSREMVLTSAGHLIEADDGGIYKHEAPAGVGGVVGKWLTKAGDLANFEAHNADWDGNFHVAMAGFQDNGTGVQPQPGDQVWDTAKGADGGIVQIDDTNAAESIRYFSAQNFGSFQRQTIHVLTGIVTEDVQPELEVIGSGGMSIYDVDEFPLLTRFELNRVNHDRLVVGGKNHVFESLFRGDEVTDLGIFTGEQDDSEITALAYGGWKNSLQKPDVLYFGSDAGNDLPLLWLRSDAGAFPTLLNTYPGGVVRDIVLDTADWETAYMVDADQVWMTPDAGTSWMDVTGNMGNDGFRTIEFMSTPAARLLLVGGLDGVWYTSANNPGLWTLLGNGMDLPHAPVWDLRYDHIDDVLIAGTLGRGVWLYENASSLVPEPANSILLSFATCFAAAARRRRHQSL